MKKHSSPISGIATAGYDNKIILWDKRKNIPINVGNHEHLANQCSFSPCGNLLISASSDYFAKLWKVPSMELVATFLDHSDDVEMAAFHPSKKLIATACREQLDEAMSIFSKRGGVILYLKQEGRGIGLYNKLDAYGLQNLGHDTVDANKILGFEDDQREYQVAVDILSCLKIKKVNILTNNLNKMDFLIENGVEVNRRDPTGLFLKKNNVNYLRTKAQKSGHLIDSSQHFGGVLS